MNSAPDQFGPNVPIDRVLRALVPQAEWEKTGNAAQFLAQVAVPGTALLSDFQPAGDQRASFKLKVGLKAGAQAPPQVFNMQLVADRWQPTPENADSVAGLATAAKTALTAVVKRAREDVAAGRRSGNLPAVFAAFDSVKDVLPAMSDVEDAAALQKLMVAIPPAWEQKQLELSSQGFAADGEADKVTGYPSRLKDGRGKTLLLVSMPPADELWDKLKGRAKAGEPLSTAATQGPDERPWRIFYVDSAESQAVNDFAQAATLAQSLGREVPTRDEWTLAALKLGGNSPEGMFDGLREWCADEAEAGQWACGGCTRTVRGKAQVLPAPPKNPGNFDDMWRWLTDPLVMQKRGAQFGDDLTGVRLVLRVK